MSTSTRIYGKITVIKRNGSNGSQFPVTGSTCTFGRESDCEIRIQLPNVSSHECQLLADENGRFVVSKLNKKGEILVNDKALAAQVAVNHNDVLTIAGRSFRFEYPPQQREKMAAAKVVAGTPRPSAVDRLRQTERRRVSFGPQLSPEQFDLKLPPNTPVKKGAIPMKNLSNTDDISQHHSLLKTAKRRSIGKSASQKATDGKKEKPAKKRSFDKLVELVGLDKPKKTEPNEVEDKTTKAASAGQLDFFGAIKKTPKAAVTGHTKSCCTSLQISSSESKQDETKELETVTPVDKKKPTTPAEKRRSMSKSTAPTGNEVETAASKSSQTTDQKKRRSKVVTPQPLEEASPNDLEDEPKTDDGKVSSQKRRSTKSSGDLDDTLPVEVGEVKPTTPAQKRQSMTKDFDDVVQEDASDVVVTASVQKKCRSKVATPQPSREVCDASLPESAATSDDHSDVTQGDRSEPITPKQKKKSMSKIATPARDEETEKYRKFSKVQTPKTPVQAAATSEQEAVTPLHKQRSMSKSAKKDDQRGTSSAAATLKVSEVLTHATKRKSLSKQQSDSLDDTVGVEESLPIDDDNQKKIVLIVQEQTPARQPESTPQSPDMILEIGVQTPAAPPSSKNTPRLSSVTPRSETPLVKAEEGSIETPVAVPSSKKTRRVSRRSMAACPEIPLAEAEHAGDKTPMTLLSSNKMPRSSRRSKTPHSNIPLVETAQQSRRSMIAEAAKSLYQIPSNSAILTARRKSLRHRKSGVLLWSDVVRKNANKHLEPKTEAVQLQKVTKAARRSLPRTPKRAQNLRHVDSPATIYIRRKMKPRRSFTPAPLDMSGDWTSDDGNTTVEDSFVLSQSTVNNGDVTMDYEADPRVRTPKVKGQPVEDNFGTKRLLETPKEKVKGQPVEEHLGTKRLLKTPKVKGQAVEEHFGTKRLLKTPKDKVKGQPVDDHFGTKRLVKTPKDKVKGQPVKEHFGTKRLLTTPKCKVKGHPVEEHFGTKRLLKTPQEKVKGQPVEEHFGTKRLLKTPKDKVKGQPVDKHFGTKRLLRTPVDKVKGEAVQDEFGTKRLFCSPKVKGQPVEYNFGMKRLLNVPETKHKNEPVEDDLCLEQIFGYDADVDETPSDETQPSVNKPPAASKKSAGKTSKAKSTKSSTVDADEKSVERVHTRTRKSERKQSSESDSNEKRATRNSKVKSTDIDETPSDSDKPQPTDPLTASKTTRSKLTEQRKSSDTESDSGEKRATRRTKVKSGDVTETESSRSARKRRQSDDSDSSESAPKKKGARSKGRPTKKDIAAPASSQDSVGTPNTRRSSRSRVQKTSDDMPEKPKVASPKTKLTAIPEVEEPVEAVAAELTPVKQTSGEQVKAQEPDDESRCVSQKMNAPPSKAAENPSTIDAAESEKATDIKTSAVRSSRRGKAVLDQPDTTTAQEEAPEPKKAVKKTQSAAGKKVKATAVKTTEASQSTRVSRRGRPALANAVNDESEMLKNEPAAKKAKSEAKQVEPPARRTTKAAKSEPVKDDSEQEEKETRKRATTTRKRKTSDADASNTKDASDVKPSTRKQKASDVDAPKSKKIAEAKSSRPTRSAAAAPEPVRKSTRVRKAK